MNTLLLSAGLIAAMLCTTVATAAPALTMEEAMVKSPDPGIEIYVRNKHPAGLTTFRPDRTVLFVHGATYPAETAFDLKLDGKSWMEFIAEHGYDVWMLDLRGYGKSTRPSEMAAAPEANSPLVRGDTAVKDIGTAVDYILKKRHLSKLNLIGWSWGTTLMATYTTQNAAKVQRLVLYAPSWLRQAPPPAAGPLGAYRLVTKDQARERWYNGVAEDKKAALIPPGWFDAWANATWASDPMSAKQNPPVLRATNGVMQDGREFHVAGKPYYGPAKITVPTLLVVGEWDHDTPPYMAQTLFPLMVNAPGKRLVELPEGTHHIVMEKNRMELFRTVQAFLDEGKQ